MLMLRETEGWPYEDIAKFEGITLDALKSALKRARKSFRDAYATLADQRGLWGAALAPFSAAARRVRSAMSRAEVQLAAPLAGLASSLSGQVASLMVVAGIATASVGAGSAPINPSLASASHSEAASATTAPARSAASSSAPPGVPGADGRRVSLRMPSDQLTGRQPATASPGADVDADGEYMSLVTEVVIHITGQSDAYVGPDVWIDCNGSRTTRATCDAMGSAPNG
jgi:hypothetical protein